MSQTENIRFWLYVFGNKCSQVHFNDKYFGRALLNPIGNTRRRSRHQRGSRSVQREFVVPAVAHNDAGPAVPHQIGHQQSRPGNGHDGPKDYQPSGGQFFLAEQRVWAQLDVGQSGQDVRQRNGR